MSTEKNDTITPQEAALAIVRAAQAKVGQYAKQLEQLQKAEAVGDAKLNKSMFGLPSSTPSQEALTQSGPNANKQYAPTRTVFKILAMRKSEALKKAETFISNSDSAVHKDRMVEKGKPKGNLPPQLATNWSGKNDSKPEAEKDAPGSGGEMKKEEMIAPGITQKSDGTMKPPAPPKQESAAPSAPAGVPAAPKPSAAPKSPPAPAAAGSVGPTKKTEVGVFKKLALKKKLK